MNTNSYTKFLLIFSMLFFGRSVFAQEEYNYLKVAKEKLAEEIPNCKSARNNYEMHLATGGKKDTLLEKEIRDCFCDEIDQELEKGDCRIARLYFDEYKDFNNICGIDNSGLDNGLEDKIKKCENPPTTGFLKLQGDESLLSEATITIDGKDARYATQRPQPLDIGEHKVRVVLDCYKPFEQTVIIKGGETKPLSVGLSPTCKEIALLAKTGADIYVDGRFKGTSNWTGKLGFGSYEVECRMKGCKSSRKDIYVNGLTQTPIRLPDPKPFIVNFATVNFAYGFEPQWSIGVGYGRLEWEPFGWFVSVMTNFNSVSVTGDCDAEGFLIDGTCPGFKGQQQRSRLSIMAGGILPFFMDDLYLRIGLGYGERGLYWKSNDGLFYRNLGYSIRGIDCSLGFQAHFGQVIWSADYVVTNLKFKQFFEVKMGIGLTF